MFRRRQKLSYSARVREFFWPRSGWGRASRYVFHRVARIPGTPHDIAAGFACGAAMSFTPFVGAHILFAVAMAFALRANLVASVIGTVVGNPWSFPFIWILIYRLGRWAGFGEGTGEAETLDFAELFGHMLDAVLSFDFVYLLETAWPVWWPMMVGSVPTAIVAWFAFYYLIRAPVSAYQRRRVRFVRVTNAHGHREP